MPERHSIQEMDVCPGFDPNTVEWPTLPFPLDGRLQLLVRYGSEAHGTYRPPTEPDSIDDRDLLGVVVPPLGYYLGTREWSHASSIKGQWDVCLHSVGKFVGLLCKQNPNVLTALWCREEDVLVKTDFGASLRVERLNFVDAGLAYHSFVGYAHGQFKRMTSFGKYRGYMGAKRKALVEQHGYDTKNAAHLVRILRMGVEFLRDGVLNVYRADADELVAIKRGEWTLERVKREADLLFTEAKTARAVSALPEAIDRDWVELYLIEWTARLLLREYRGYVG